jgi:serine/threonine protein kinase
MPRETIARYEIRSELGRGGMAVVYLAYDPNFRRNVAIKLVSGSFQDNSTFRERFEREAHLIASIEHPAIVPVYDYGEQDDQLYLVMRYMPGGALTSKIKEGVITLGYSAQIISQIAPALDAVHSQGIVHRDLKPGNILLDGFGNPAISDFGIAHFTAATSDLTGSAVIGTPSYMSPEQVRADVDLDGRSDIYALGVILFEMLTGRGPFTANTPMSVALKHLTDPLPSIRAFRPDLPIELESILGKALAKDREKRYASASELVSALRVLPGADANKNTHPEVRFSIPRNNEETPTEVDMPDNAGVSNRQFNSQPYGSQNPPTPEVVQPKSIGTSPGQATGLSKPPNRALQILAIAGIAVVLLFLCGSMGLLGTWAGLVLPGLFPGQALPPTSAATDIANSQEIILFSDDFTDPNRGWPSGQTPAGEYGYQSGSYRMLAIGSGSLPWVSFDLAHDNLSLYVDATPISGNGHYGLLCRIQNGQNFYYFVIGNNGSYDIGKFTNGEVQSFFTDGGRYSNAINQGNQTNRIKADCKGNTLRLYANNLLLGEAVDTDFDSGDTGLTVGTLDSGRFEVIFDDFLITTTDQ